MQLQTFSGIFDICTLVSNWWNVLFWHNEIRELGEWRGSIGFDVDVLTKLEISGLMIEIDVDWTNKQTNEKFVAENFSIRVKSVIAHKVSSLNALCSPYHITKSIKLKALAGCGQTMWKVQLQCDLVCLFEIDAAAYCVYVFRVS